MQHLGKRIAQEAIAKLQQFIAANPAENPVQLALMEISISQIYAEELKKPAEAVAVIEKGMARSPDPGSYFRLASTKCYILASTRQYKEANTYFKEILPKYLEQPPGVVSSSLALLLQYYHLYIVRNASTPEELISTFRAVMETHPYSFSSSRMATQVVETLMAESGKEKEALSWAKLYWMTCNYDEKTISDATTLLQKAWIAAEMNPAKGTDFLKALQDPQAPNPLKDVPLPTLDAAKLQTLQKNMSATTPQNQIIIHLLLGQNGDAMLMARRLMLNDPVGKANTAALEMARIFKATDLNMVRANALLQFLQTGQGENPVDNFFKENPVQKT